MACSDSHLAHVCGDCGGLLTVQAIRSLVLGEQGCCTSDWLNDIGMIHLQAQVVSCRNPHVWRANQLRMSNQSICPTSTGTFRETVLLCFISCIHRFLTNELAAMGIKMTLKLSE